MRQALKDLAFELEPKIIEKTTIPSNWDPDQLTSRLWGYNLFDFDYQVVRDLKDHIAAQYEDYVNELHFPIEKCYVHGWVNILRTGQRIGAHHHSDAHCNAPGESAYVSGNVCISAENTKTYYSSPYCQQNAAGLNNNPGDMFLFPSFIIHRTDKNESQEPRISYAFDIIVEKIYKEKNPEIFVPLN